MKITFFDVKENERESLSNGTKHMFTNMEVLLSPNTLNSPDLSGNENSDFICIRESSKATAEIIDSLPNLKLILARTTGYDNIDLAKCKEKGIVVCNVPSYGEHTVAEFAFALILALSRRVQDCIREVKETDKFSWEGLTGFDLCEKTLGVIGTGRIGQHVIKIAKGFDMNVIAFDTFPRPELQSQLGFTYVPLDRLFATSDIITLHVPALKETRHMIDATALSKMKSGAYIINTSRGAVVDTMALKKALAGGQLAGAGLDVLENEKVAVDTELLAMKNVIITPHNAFNTKEAIERRIQITLENLLAFQKGTPQNEVK